MRILISTIILLLPYLPLSAQGNYPLIKISDDIELLKLSEKAYVHTSRSEMKGFGMVSSNGLLLVDNHQAFLFDTPVTNSQTEILVKWISDSLHAKVTTFVPNHWHEDCMGGLAYLHSTGVKSYASRMTIDISREEGLPVPQNGFRKSKTLKLNDIKLVCYYPGAAHSMDNIVVWVPSEKILFAGCMAKATDWNLLGNTSDGSVDDYGKTVRRVMQKFAMAKVVIPGHGQIGGFEILIHTCQLVNNQKNPYHNSTEK